MDDSLQAPTPEQAYEDAPDLSEEMLYLLDFLGPRIAKAPTDDGQREFLLRRAAIQDRLWCEPDGDRRGNSDLEYHAEQLRRFDKQHETGLGPVSAENPHWDWARLGLEPDDPYSDHDPPCAGYVRQEYVAFLAAEAVREQALQDQEDANDQAVYEQALQDRKDAGDTAPAGSACTECGHPMEWGEWECLSCGHVGPGT